MQRRLRREEAGGAERYDTNDTRTGRGWADRLGTVCLDVPRLYRRPVLAGGHRAQEILRISALLSFSAGLLTLTLTIPRRQRPWSAALLVSLILNGYWPFASFSELWFVLIPPLASLAASLVALPFVVQFLVAALVPATPALLALGYTIRAAGRATPAPQAPQTVEEGSLDITIEPIESETC